LAGPAFAETTKVTKFFSLQSTQGLRIGVNVKVGESESDAWGNRNRSITYLSLGTSSFGDFRTVFVLNCRAFRYPREWSYVNSFSIDGTQASGGAPFEARSVDRHQIEYAGYGGDSDTCRTELALVKDGVWQIDPINGTNNFVLDL
jgi:3'-phosphoadenosine 5'-phosphosulfate (PAPS) 3'-phosphatase